MCNTICNTEMTITVRIGDELLDASVLRQLGAAQRHLTGRSAGRA